MKLGRCWKGIVAYVKGEDVDDLDAWIAEQSQGLRGNTRWSAVQALLLDRQRHLDC